MPSTAQEDDLAQLLSRVAMECPAESSVWLGPGLPRHLKDTLAHARVKADPPANLAVVEVRAVSQDGKAEVEATIPDQVDRVIGIGACTEGTLSQLIRESDGASTAIDRLICPLAVFDFRDGRILIREIRRGLTAADLQRDVLPNLWAEPNLKELGTD